MYTKNSKERKLGLFFHKLIMYELFLGALPGHRLYSRLFSQASQRNVVWRQTLQEEILLVTRNTPNSMA